jgi:hypothetical protein
LALNTHKRTGLPKSKWLAGGTISTCSVDDIQYKRAVAAYVDVYSFCHTTQDRILINAAKTFLIVVICNQQLQSYIADVSESESFAEPNMPQDRESGAEASRYGHDCARQIANAIGAKMRNDKVTSACGTTSESLSKLPIAKTSSVGVLYHMIDRLDAVLGAFEERDGEYRVMQLPIARCAAVMEPTRSTGASAGRVGMVSRKLFEDEGRLVGVVRVEFP